MDLQNRSRLRDGFDSTHTKYASNFVLEHFRAQAEKEDLMTKKRNNRPSLTSTMDNIFYKKSRL